MIEIEAAKTTASAGEVWVICVVAVFCLAFWLSMVTWADRHPVWRGRQVPEMPGPVLGGMHVAGGGRSVAPNRDAPATLTDDIAGQLQIPGQRGANRPQHRATAASPASQRGAPLSGARSEERSDE